MITSIFPIVFAHMMSQGHIAALSQLDAGKDNEFLKSLMIGSLAMDGGKPDATASFTELGSTSGVESSAAATTGAAPATVTNLIPIVDDDYPYACKCVRASRSHRHGMASLADASAAHCLDDETTHCVPLDFAGRDQLMVVIFLIMYMFKRIT